MMIHEINFIIIKHTLPVIYNAPFIIMDEESAQFRQI